MSLASKLYSLWNLEEWFPIIVVFVWRRVWKWLISISKMNRKFAGFSFFIFQSHGKKDFRAIKNRKKHDSKLSKFANFSAQIFYQ